MAPKSKPALGGLTARMQAFVRAFVVCRNGAEAARKAGYSPDVAKQAAYRLLQRADVQAVVREHEEGDERMVGSRRHYVLNRLKDLVERSMQADPVRGAKGKKLGLYKQDGPTAARALELLGKQEGLFREQLDVRVQAGVEELLTGIRPLMTPQSYAELLTALAEVTGVTRMAPEADAGSGTDAVH